MSRDKVGLKHCNGYLSTIKMYLYICPLLDCCLHISYKLFDFNQKVMVYKCYCENWAVERIARIDANAGQKIVGCDLDSRGCGFFRWVDGCIRCRNFEVEVKKVKLEARK